MSNVLKIKIKDNDIINGKIDIKLIKMMTILTKMGKKLILDINNNFMIKIIPHIEGIVKINCNFCYNLIMIPDINSLIELNCKKCIHLRNIPFLHNLRYLNCTDSSLYIYFKDINEYRYFLNKFNKMPRVQGHCIYL